MHVERIDRCRRRGFGQAVSLQQRHADRFQPALGHRRLHRHAPPQRDIHGRKIELGEIGIVEQGVEQRIDAGHYRHRVLAPFLDEAGNVARIGNQQVAGADHQEGQAVRGQREDVIERQGGDDEFLAVPHHRLDPGVGLHDVGGDIAVTQHGALGNTGRTAGVLQEGDIVVIQRHRLPAMLPAACQRRLEADGTGQLPGRHQLLDVANDEVDQRALQAAEHFAHRRHDDMPDRGVGDDLLQRMGEVFDDDDGRRPAILHLVFQLARRVQRVAIDHDATGAQRAKKRHRVLQQVGHHQRHPVTLFQTERLQPAGKGPGLLVKFAVGHRTIHADVGDLVGIGRTGLLEQGHQRRHVIDADVGRDALRVTLQPDFFHVSLLLRNFRYRAAPS